MGISIFMNFQMKGSVIQYVKRSSKLFYTHKYSSLSKVECFITIDNCALILVNTLA